MIPFYRLTSINHELQSLRVVGRWNPSKLICPLTQQPLDRKEPWFTSGVEVYHCARLPDDRQPGLQWDDRLQELNAPRLLGDLDASMIVANEQAKLILETLDLPLGFAEVKHLPLLERDTPFYYPVDPYRKHYLLQTHNSLDVDLQRTKIEWQTNCPGCGRTYPLLHTMKEPTLHTPNGAETRLFTLAQWPDSYIYIDEPTLRLWKELGIRGLKSPEDPFGVIEWVA